MGIRKGAPLLQLERKKVDACSFLAPILRTQSHLLPFSLRCLQSSRPAHKIKCAYATPRWSQLKGSAEVDEKPPVWLQVFAALREMGHAQGALSRLLLCKSWE